jgi:LuxR family maltose regulon positive regulatory protein
VHSGYYGFVWVCLPGLKDCEDQQGAPVRSRATISADFGREIPIFRFTVYNKPMASPVLATKLFIPPVGEKLLRRDRLLKQLHQGNEQHITLVSAAAGFGKTTIISQWLHECGLPAAWLSLDEEHNDPVRFLLYLICAVQKILPEIGKASVKSLSSSSPPPVKSVLAGIINELSLISQRFILVLDDYHILESESVDAGLSFFLDNQPQCIHLVIVTREDPPLPLTKLRGKGRLNEIRASDLRFFEDETQQLLSGKMGLEISPDNISALTERTEGWIAGLHLAAVSLRGKKHPEQFVEAFAGSNRYILDYLVEEVLEQQPKHIQEFLLHTSVLNRLCGELCDAVFTSTGQSGQETLEYLERANLFIIPLDDQRRWYRYHHLFGEFLRQRLLKPGVTDARKDHFQVEGLHKKASFWYEENGYELEAFHHATAAEDTDRTESLIIGKGMPLHFRGGVYPVLNWLNGQPKSLLQQRPALAVIYASALLFAGKTGDVEEKLLIAEEILPRQTDNEEIKDLIGHIAAVRATLALTRHDGAGIFKEARKALANLHPDNLPVLTGTTWLLGYAHHLAGDFDKAHDCYTKALESAKKIGHLIVTISTLLGLGKLQELSGRLTEAEAAYRETLTLSGNPPLPVAAEAFIGLSRVAYEQNRLGEAQKHIEACEELAVFLENTDRQIAAGGMKAKILLAQGQPHEALNNLSGLRDTAVRKNFLSVLPELESIRVKALLFLGRIPEALEAGFASESPADRMHCLLAQGKPQAVVELYNQLPENKENTRIIPLNLEPNLLYTIAVMDTPDKALETLTPLLHKARAAGFIRTFIDVGKALGFSPLDELLAQAVDKRIYPDYTAKLLQLLKKEAYLSTGNSPDPAVAAIPRQLSSREIEVLSLIAQGLSNSDISERLYISLSTVKGHNRQIFEKLDVNRRTQAVAKAKQTGILP